MKKPNLIIIIFGVIVLIAGFTNPSTEEHKDAVKAIVNQHVQNSISENESDAFQNIGVLLGGSLIDNLIENIVSRENYLLFSITKGSWKGNKKTIGYGLFGNVFISNEVNEAFTHLPDETYTEETIEPVESY